MSELINHVCSVEGSMMIEEGKPCNWCDEFDGIEEIKKEKKEVIENGGE